MPNVENRRVPRPTKYVGSVNGIEPDKISKELFITGEDIPTTKEEGSNTVAEDIQILYDRPIAIKDEEKILDVSEGKIGSTLSLEQDPDHPLTYHLIGKDNIIISTISFPKDLFLKSVTYDSSTKELVFVFETSSGEQTVRVDVSDLVDIYSAGDGLTLTNGVFAIDTTRVATQNDIATLTDEKADKIPVWEEIAYDANNFSVPAGDRVAFDTTKIPALTLLNPTIPGGLLSDTPSTPYTGHLLGIWTNDNLEFHF
ncbi:MAG: hypothetical protein LBG52_07500 [Candidatus Peribacteria bacterium]|jgi:hypothetical protein|nr:hypothetical protein [Candidatus Peribacteria bacterium]